MNLINFLHTFNPAPIMVSFGPIHIYWYGLFMVLGVLAAIFVATVLAKFYKIKAEIIIDLAFWLIIGGLAGARIFYVFLEFPYYLINPLLIFKVWQGGLAIHGAIIGGALALWFFTKKYQQNFYQLAAILTTALPLAQAIGRWGNYFNQELFGRPTGLPWGIPIKEINRPWQYFNYEYFQPTFLYESLGNLAVFLILILLQIWLIKKPEKSKLDYGLGAAVYLFFYSLLRLFMEFLRTDHTPVIWGWRFPQLVSLFIMVLTVSYFVFVVWWPISKNKTLDKKIFLC